MGKVGLGLWAEFQFGGGVFWNQIQEQGCY